MVILSAKQIHDWDQYSIQHEPIVSVDLMEAASIGCVQWLQQQNYLPGEFHIFCGKGNNGGDGLAIARLLSKLGAKVSVHILELGQLGTNDFQINLARLHETDVAIHYIQSENHFPILPPAIVVIDALFGTGLNRKLDGLAAALVQHINIFSHNIISIDMPSGLLADDSSVGYHIVNATHTISFQCQKMAFMMAENEMYTGHIHVLDIGLLNIFLSTITYEASLLEIEFIKAIYHPRSSFSHKGTYGHAGIVAGSYGFMGAAILAAKACLRSGVGKLTVHTPSCGYDIIQSTIPEAMCKVEEGEQYIQTITDTATYAALGIGPGMGHPSSHVDLLDALFTAYSKPMVIDADALTVIASYPALLNKIPPFSILTPHPAEFDRVFGKSKNDFERVRMARQKAKELQLIIVLKGHRSFIAMPGGINYFNSTGNPGMATAGSGDVLTGILTGLLAQGYAPEQAALMGVYIHGLAGDHAAAMLTEEAMIASDITDYLGSAYSVLKKQRG